MGFFTYFIYIHYLSWVAFFELLFDGRDFALYLEGPFRRFVLGSFIYLIGLFTLWIPGVNYLLAPLLGWWAVADYYDY